MVVSQVAPGTDLGCTGRQRSLRRSRCGNRIGDYLGRRPPGAAGGASRSMRAVRAVRAVRAMHTGRPRITRRKHI